MSEPKSFESERIYWAVEQVERKAGDIDELHLDENEFYIKSEADKVIAEKDKVIAELKDKLRHYPMMVALLERDKKEIEELKATCVHTDNSAVIENMANELERLRPMETALELAEADNRGYLARIKELEAKIKELEAKLPRLRIVSKCFPSADDWYFLALWEDGLPDIGYIGAEDDVIETIRDRGEDHSIEWWMPLPDKPEGTIQGVKTNDKNNRKNTI